jgi:large subunit ribosomal protein L9
MAKLILMNEVAGLGSPGDIVDVKNGYARNFLIPQGFAVAWSDGGQKQVDQIRDARLAKVVASEEDAQALKDALEKNPIVVSAKAGSGQKLFGSITRNDIAAAIEAAGITGVDKRSIDIPTPIKTVGPAEVLVKIQDGVFATVALSVESAK